MNNQNYNYYSEIAAKYKREDAKRGEQLFIEIMNKKNEKSEEYYYEILIPTNEYSKYDVQIQKHHCEDWGSPEISYHEVKTRNRKSTDFNYSIIDLYKISELQKVATMSGKAVFINMFYEKDRTLLIWQIDPEGEYETEEKDVTWTNATKAAGYDVKVHKKLAKLNNDEAIKIRY